MNLKDKRVRRKAVAFAGASAIIAAGGVTAAQVASAAGTLTLFPSTTAVNTLNFAAAGDGDSGTANFQLTTPLAESTYALRVTTSTSSPVYALLTAAPTSSAKLFTSSQANAGGGVPSVATTWAASGQLSTGGTTTTPAITAGNRLFVTADVPGTYKVKFYEDIDAGGTLSDADNVSPEVTINVLDAYANTSSITTDDWKPTVTTTSTVTKGLPITSTVDLSGLTLADARGSSAGAGVLGDEIADLVSIQYSGAVTSATAATTYGTTTTARTLAGSSVTTAGTVTATANFDSAGDGVANADTDLGTADTTVTSNNVTAIATTTADVVGSVKVTGQAAKVKPGTAAVTYTATVTDSDTDKSGNVVYFTLDPTPDTVVLTGTGTQISRATGTAVYSATTNSSGVASITVTSDTTTAATSYTVTAATNNVAAAAGHTVTTTYEAPAATTFSSTNTSAELVPTVGTSSVTLKGSLLDQFGAAFQPASSAAQQVTVTVDTSASTCGTYAAADATGYATISAGTFTFAYTPATAAAAGQCDVFRFAYAGATNLDTALKWSSTVAPATVTLTTPNAAATGVNLSDFDTIAPGQAAAVATDFGSATGEVTGTVKDSTGTLLAYKTVTLTGSDGVYFSATTSGATMVTSMTTTTNASGAFGGVYAFFTKAGAAKITATSGAVKADASVTTDASADPYKVIAIDAAGTSGSVIVVTGKVLDMFGNPVPSQAVTLSAGTSTLGVLGATSPTTNADGVWSTTYTTGANQSGTATLTASVGSSSKTPDPTWASLAKLTLANGEYQDTATITVGSGAPTLSGPAKASAGSVTLTGTAPANAQVDIYAKKAGSSDAFAWVGSAKADGTTGDWSKAVTVSASTTFIAKVGTAASSEVTVALSSSTKASVTVTAKALGGKKARISVKGSPAKASSVVLYIKSGSKWVKVRTVTTTSAGTTSITVKTSTGTKTFKVVYTAPGSSAVSKTVSVKVS